MLSYRRTQNTQLKGVYAIPTATSTPQRRKLPDELLTAREAAERYPWLSEGMLKKLRLQERVNCYKVGSLVFYAPEDLEQIPHRVEARYPV